MSSRNVYLSAQERQDALNISKALKMAAKSIGMGQKDTLVLKKQIQTILSEVDLEIEYIHILNRDFKQIEIIELQNTIMLIAVKIGNTRLIDNLWI